MRWIFYHGVFGGWGWEQVGEDGRGVAESRGSFESREEAELDAVTRGYVPERTVSAPGAEAAEY